MKNFRIKFWYIPALFVMIVIAQIIGENHGMLDQSRSIIWYDNLMHVFAGILSAIFVMWAVEKEEIKISKNKLGLYLLAVVIIMAGLWEFFEWGVFQIIKDYNLMSKPLTTNLSEAILDSLSNLLGGLASLFLLRRE